MYKIIKKQIKILKALYFSLRRKFGVFLLSLIRFPFLLMSLSLEAGGFLGMLKAEVTGELFGALDLMMASFSWVLLLLLAPALE